MNEVKAYQTVSGLLTVDKQAAEQDEKDFLFKSNIEKLVDDHCWNNMQKSDVADFIIDNQKEISILLKRA